MAAAALAAAVLADDKDQDLSWQDRALCAQTDPEAFSPTKAAPPAKPSASAGTALCGPNASNTH